MEVFLGRDIFRGSRSGHCNRYDLPGTVLERTNNIL